jgi:hypothetical protein
MAFVLHEDEEVHIKAESRAVFGVEQGNGHSAGHKQTGPKAQHSTALAAADG